MLTFAQFERELASERTRDKIAQKAKRGLYFGGRPPLGYKFESGRFIQDKKRAPIVKEVFSRFIETRSVRELQGVVERMGLRTRTGRLHGNSYFWHMLRKPRSWPEKIVHKGKVYQGHHVPIISGGDL